MSGHWDLTFGDGANIHLVRLLSVKCCATPLFVLRTALNSLVMRLRLPDVIASSSHRRVASLKRIHLQLNSSQAHPTSCLSGAMSATRAPTSWSRLCACCWMVASDAYLHMFGGGSLRTSLRRRIEGYENRIRLGDYADAVTATAYMRACDWLVIPSRIESIPLVFVDALHMGIPVVAAAVGDLDLLVTQYDVGVVAKPEDPAALAAAMRQAMAFPRAAYAPALARASEEFNLVRSATRCADALVAATERQA